MFKTQSETTSRGRVVALQSCENFMEFLKIDFSLIIMVYTEPMNMQEFFLLL